SQITRAIESGTSSTGTLMTRRSAKKAKPAPAMTVSPFMSASFRNKDYDPAPGLTPASAEALNRAARNYRSPPRNESASAPMSRLRAATTIDHNDLTSRRGERSGMEAEQRAK